MILCAGGEGYSAASVWMDVKWGEKRPEEVYRKAGAVGGGEWGG
jgi:hypothetical protein